MDRVREYFKDFPAQQKVALMLLGQGVHVTDGVPYIGDIEITDSAIGRAAGVDRRVVRTTLQRIDGDPVLKTIFSKLRGILLMSEVASEIGCTTLEIIPTDATKPGILKDVTDVIFRAGVSVRQAVVDDPGFQRDAHLIVVVQGTLPPEFLPMLRQCNGVASIILR
jgi:uncharacterized protein